MAAKQRRRAVSVTGTGRASGTPDRAVVTVGVRVVRPSAVEARVTAAAQISRILAAIAARGVPDRDLATTQLSLGERVSYDRDGAPRREGYEAATSLTVRLHDLDEVGPLIDAATEAGATTLDGLSFDVEDPAPLARQALEGAMADARAKAEVLARSAGAALGGVVDIIEQGGVAPPHPMARMAKMDLAATESVVMPGTTEIVCSVAVTFELEAAPPEPIAG